MKGKNCDENFGIGDTEVKLDFDLLIYISNVIDFFDDYIGNYSGTMVMTLMIHAQLWHEFKF